MSRSTPWATLIALLAACGGGEESNPTDAATIDSAAIDAAAIDAIDGPPPIDARVDAAIACPAAERNA